MDARVIRATQIEGQVAAGVTVTRTVRWKRPMRLTRFWFGALIAGNPNLESAFTNFRIANQWGWYLATDTQNPAFLNVQALFGRLGTNVGRQIQSRKSWVPLNLAVKPGDLWTIDIQNATGTVNPPQPPSVISPVLLLEVEDLPHVADAGVAV